MALCNYVRVVVVTSVRDKNEFPIMRLVEFKFKFGMKAKDISTDEHLTLLRLLYCSVELERGVVELQVVIPR